MVRSPHSDPIGGDRFTQFIDLALRRAPILPHVDTCCLPETSEGWALTIQSSSECRWDGRPSVGDMLQQAFGAQPQSFFAVEAESARAQAAGRWNVRSEVSDSMDGNEISLFKFDCRALDVSRGRCSGWTLEPVDGRPAGDKSY